jgi:hypothetical protein
MTYKIGTRDGRGIFKTKWARPRLLPRLEAIVSVEILLGETAYTLKTEGQCPITKVQELFASRHIYEPGKSLQIQGLVGVLAKNQKPEARS